LALLRCIFDAPFLLALPPASSAFSFFLAFCCLRSYKRSCLVWYFILLLDFILLLEPFDEECFENDKASAEAKFGVFLSLANETASDEGIAAFFESEEPDGP
jgi:hypothetical protein